MEEMNMLNIYPALNIASIKHSLNCSRTVQEDILIISEYTIQQEKYHYFGIGTQLCLQTKLSL